MESTELKTVLEDNGLSLEDKKRVLDENKVEYHEENGRIILNVPEEKKNLLACMNVNVKTEENLETDQIMEMINTLYDRKICRTKLKLERILQKTVLPGNAGRHNDLGHVLNSVLCPFCV